MAEGAHSTPDGPVAAGAVPADLTAALEHLARRGERGSPVLVASDFDGVVSPLVDDPSRSRPTPAAAQALARLAAADPARVRTALVSGRHLEGLAAAAQAPAGMLLVGSHGAEHGRALADGVAHEPVDLTPEQAHDLARVTAALEAVAADAPGAWVEHKPTAAVLHVRLASPQDAAAASTAALEAASALGVPAQPGRDVVEAAVVPTSKGVAIETLRARTGAVAVFYMGDDLTDENAFRVMGADDVSVRVGPGETRAAHRVHGTDGAAAVLTALADLLAPEGAPAPS